VENIQLKTPIVFIIFNRPRLSKLVFEKIRQARPQRLYVIADGPRKDNSDDLAKCHAAREIIETVDWPCAVFKNYSAENLGCGLRLSTGISWVFEKEEEAIILEDDCVPHPFFFRFCTELLDKFRSDESIMHISGNNCAIVSGEGRYSYYFSRIPHCWGWATWRRAWRHYDFELRELPDTLLMGKLAQLWKERIMSRYWEHLFKKIYLSVQKHTWDYQWTFACLTHGGLSIIPNVTLVTNIGFTPDATHTKKLDHPLAALPVGEIGFPLLHPERISCDEMTDIRMLKDVFGVNRINDFLRILKNLFSRRL